MNDEAERIEALDVLRGMAVVGILLGNVIGFAMPAAAGLHPFNPADMNGAWAEQAAWALSLLLIDGKMRAIFAMLFGASMLLSLERAALDGRDGAAMHRARMITLLPIGLAHYVLLFHGDILMLLAIAGLMALPLANREPLALLKWAGGLLGLQMIFNLVAVTHPFMLRAGAGTDDAAQARWQALAQALAMEGGSAGPLALADRISHLPATLLDLVLFALPETLAFIALGMAMLKGGFLAAQWPPAQFRQTAVHGYRIGLAGTGALVAWVLMSGDSLVGQAVTLAASLPFRVPLAVAHAALVMLMVAIGALPALRARLAALGRLALSAYLLSSLTLAALFAPWGAQLFGVLGRAQLLLLAMALGAALLLLAPAWRRWSGQGPVERLWRAASRRLAARLA